MRHSLLALTLLTLCAACSTKSTDERNITVGDTITTESGLKYVFTRIGTARWLIDREDPVSSGFIVT